jgi:hypothetical protein
MWLTSFFTMKVAVVVFALSLFAANAMNSAEPAKTGYAPVNGLQMYYEIHGPANTAQPPLVLLHGGRHDRDVIWTNSAGARADAADHRV